MNLASVTHLKPKTEKLQADRDGARPPIVVIGGVLTMKQIAPLYGNILHLDKSSKGRASERFVPPHNRGTGPVEETRTHTREQLLREYDRLGQRKMLLVGHSLGGLIAAMYATEEPETVAGVVCLAGVQEGVRYKTPAMQALIRYIGNPAAAELVKYDSSFIQEHAERVKENWPVDAPLHAVAAPLDILLPAPHGFGLKPNGHASENKLVVPYGFGLNPIGRRIMRSMPEGTGFLPSMVPAEHMLIPLVPAVVQYVASVHDQLSKPEVYAQPIPINPAV